MAATILRIALVPSELRSYTQCFPTGRNCTEPGFVVEYWLYLGKLLNFTPSFVAANGFGDSEPAATNTTLFGRLIHNVADATGPEVMYNDLPLAYGLEVGPPFFFTPQLIFFNQQHTQKNVRSGLPLDVLTTLLLTIGLLICHGIHALIHWYTSKNNLNWPVSREMSMFSNALAWIFLNIYLSVFVSQLAIEFYDVPHAVLPFANFPELLELVNAGKWKLVYVADSFAEQQIRNRLGYTSDEQMRADARLVRLSNVNELSGYIAGKTFQAYVDSAMLLEAWRPPCDITWIVDNFIPGMPTGFYYRKEVEERFRLNYSESKITFDIFKHLENEYQRKAPVRQCGEMMPRIVDALSILQTSSIFLILMGGLLVSLMAFGIEKHARFWKSCCTCAKSDVKNVHQLRNSPTRRRRSARLNELKQKELICHYDRDLDYL